MSRSPHGLDDSDTIGSKGYDVHSRGEVFLQSNWPKGSVWDKIWNYCGDHHCDGSFSAGTTEWEVFIDEIGGKTTSTITRNITVKVSGNYDRNDWGVRDAFMNDLLEHHYGDGGVYNNGSGLWAEGIGTPPGWWIAASTWIRHSESGFWVNIEIAEE